MIKVVDVTPLTQEELQAWRKRQLPGHTRHAYELHDIGGRSRPEPLTEDEGIVGPNGTVLIKKPSRPVKQLDPRRAREVYEQNLRKWLESDRNLYLEKARLLKTTSPMQFSHMTDEQLAQSIYDKVIEEKAKLAVQRVYNRRGWTKPQELRRGLFS